MTTYETLHTVDSQRYQLECALTVLREAQGYFSDLSERKLLPLYADSIDALLCVVSNILIDVSPELKKAVDGLLEHHKLLGSLR